MTQIPILNGVYADNTADFRTSYPRNLIPVPKEQGISRGYLKPADGIVSIANGPGIDRGGVNWNGRCYRVMGRSLVLIEDGGNVTILGDVGDSLQPVTFNYSFDRLAIASVGRLYYYLRPNGPLVQVTDPNIGAVNHFIWIDGYFMTTDGVSIVVTTLNNPMVANPLAYGSSEVDPDNIVCLVKIRNQAAIVNRYTIEFLQDIGGNLFPFQRIDGAEITRGAIGVKCAISFADDTIAFLGSGKKEPPAVWLGLNGGTTKISTREIDIILKQYTENVLGSAVLESRVEDGHYFLYVHLPNRTLVFDYNASQVTGSSVWFTLDSGLGYGNYVIYRARYFVWCYDKWIFGDPTSTRIGTFDRTISSHYGAKIGWEFATLIIYNQSMGAIVYEIQLVGLTGSIMPGTNPTIWTSYSTDGITWSNERPRPAGMIGERNKVLNWLQLGNMRLFRIQRFRGDSDAHIAVAALECRIEPLND